MSKLTKSEIKHIANLARLKLSESEIEKFSLQISEFLKHAEKIQEVDTTGVLETSNVTGMINSLREDKVEEGLSQKGALSNAPESNDVFFVVKKYHGNQRNTR